MIELSEKERKKYLVIKEYATHKITRKQAAAKLGVTTKTVSVLKQTYLQDGKSAFRHGLKDQRSAKRVLLDVENRIVECYQNKFSGFNFTHFYEHIEESGLLYRTFAKFTIFRQFDRPI